MKTLIRSALKYFVLFIVLYSVLTAIVLVPKVGQVCNQWYRNPTQPILSSMLPKAYLQIKPEGDHFETLNIQFASKIQVDQQMAEAKKTGKPMANIVGANNLVNYHNLFLSFLLFYVVLVLLSPISWKSKLIDLIAGSLLFYAFTLIKLYLILLIFFNEGENPIYQTGATALQIAKNVRFCMTLGTSVLMVLLIWAVLVLKRNNWMGLLGEKGE